MHKNELVNINLSLAGLGNVIHALVNNSSHVPYRDSKLTKILQDSLGGKAKTYVIATVSPTINSSDESISTLKFADRAHSVFCKVEPNEITLGVEGSQKLIKKLTSELSNLKEVLKRKKRNMNSDPERDELIRLREENDELKRYLINNAPLKRLIIENKLLRSEIQKISKSIPWTQFNTDYLDQEKDKNKDLSYNRDINNYSNMRYTPLAKVGNNIIYGNANNNSNNNFIYYQKERSAPEIEGLSKSISQIKSNMKRLDNIERENQIKTQKLIDNILKRTKAKDNSL